MNTKTLLTLATDDQLLEFVNGTLGMSVPGNALRATIMTKITAAWDKDWIMVPEVVQHAHPGLPLSLNMADETEENHPDKVTVIIQPTDDSDGAEHVQLGVNGSIMLVPRDEEAEIPWAYYLVLQNAITYKYDPLPDGGMNPKHREVPLYPYQRVA